MIFVNNTHFGKMLNFKVEIEIDFVVTLTKVEEYMR